ncbi:MAG: toprim domain-containing protein [Bacteroidales bacterium]|nr:toprim domain-containing protein [Bacteroidales bacterium]
MINPRTVEQVKDLPIKDVLEAYGLQFKRVGSAYKCCCPLHGERTPSFTVSPSRNAWKCFGCNKGGSIIDFVMEKENMTFYEAVEAIAKGNGIEIKYDRRELTEEQQNEARLAESMRITVAKIQEFFIAQFYADNPEAEIARQYAFNRWGEDFCKEAGIGYAPKDSKIFLAFIKSACLDLDTVKALGYVGTNEEHGNQYAMFRERVTIPVSDRYGRIVAFTARYVGTGKASKYMNSKTSLIYKKDALLFGIDAAAKQARSTNYFIIVEGAPDVLRLQSIGLTQAVAPLGTALTAKHLDTLRPICSVIRFIPDSDPPKGSLYGVGVDTVMKNGRMALEKGFEVSVREIPRTKEDDENEIKYDPDSYITSTEIYSDLDDVPFVVWYAKKRFGTADSQNLQMEVVQEVASLLIYISDELTREMCIDQLCRIFGKKKMWQDAMRRAGRKVREEANSSDSLDGFSQREISLLRSLGIIIKDGCYQSPDKDGNLSRWSNFIFRPVLHIKDPAKSTRILEIVNQDGDKDVIELSSSDFVALRSFRTKLIDKGNFVWRSEESSSLIAIQEYIFGITATATKIDTMGWEEKGNFFAFSNGIFADGHFYKADSLGTVNYGTHRYFLPALSELYRDNKADYSFERMFRHDSDGGTSLYDFASQLALVYGDGGKIGLIWTISAMFRDIIFSQLRCFPMLNLFGRKGSGKTELAIALASFFYVLKKTPSSCTNTTIPTIAYMLSHAVNAVVILDEFTNDLKTERIDILKGIWGGTSQSKMNTDDKRPMTIPVLSGVILGGQYKPEDEAIFSRCLHLQYNKTVFDAEEQRNFDALLDMVLRGNSHLLIEILNHRRIIERGFESAYQLTINDINTKAKKLQIEARIQKNWAIPLAVFRLLEPHINLPFTFAEIFDIFLRAMKFQNDQATTTSETAEFWQFLDSLHTSGKVREKCHYVIKTLTSFKPLGDDETRRFTEPKRVIFLNFPAIRSLLEQRYSKPKSGNTLNVATLESYLKSLPQYLGRKQQRFSFIRQNGELDEEYRTENGQQRKYINGNSPKAMCFDYDHLKEMLDLNLETFRLTEAEAIAADVDYSEPEDDLPKQTSSTMAPPPTLFQSDEEDTPF